MKAEDYRMALLKGIDKEINSLSDLDANGILWWNEFKKFVNNFEAIPKQEPIDFEALVGLINQTFGREFRVISSNVKSKYRARIRDGYKKEDILRAIIACKDHPFHVESNFQYCTPTFFAQEKTLEKYGVKKDSSFDEKITDESPVN